MHITKLRKVGGSVMLSVPPPLLEILRVHAGDEIGISVENNRLIAEPQRRRRYSLDELLAQCRPKAARADEDREWLESEPIGRELI